MADLTTSDGDERRGAVRSWRSAVVLLVVIGVVSIASHTAYADDELDVDDVELLAGVLAEQFRYTVQERAPRYVRDEVGVELLEADPHVELNRRDHGGQIGKIVSSPTWSEGGRIRKGTARAAAYDELYELSRALDSAITGGASDDEVWRLVERTAEAEARFREIDEIHADTSEAVSEIDTRLESSTGGMWIRGRWFMPSGDQLRAAYEQARSDLETLEQLLAAPDTSPRQLREAHRSARESLKAFVDLRQETSGLHKLITGGSPA